MIYTWQAQNTGGDTKKKCTSGIVFIGMCTGNVIGPLLYSTDQAPLYRKGLIADLAMFVLVGTVSAYVSTHPGFYVFGVCFVALTASPTAD